MPSPEYYHRQADLCLRMALLTSEYEERLRLLDIANGYRNGYRDDAVRVEALQAPFAWNYHAQWVPSDLAGGIKNEGGGDCSSA